MADELSILMRLRGARVVNSELNATAASVDKINAAARRSAAPMARMGKSLERTGTVLTRRLTLPIAVAAGWGVKMGLDFEDAMLKIVGLVGVSRKQVDAWKGDIISLSHETTIGMEDLANALFFVTSAGFRGDAAIRVLRASARASAAGLGDTKTVADAVTSAVNAYGEATLKASRATDVLVAGVREGKMPVENLAGSIGQVLGVASEVGVSFEEVTATAASLSRVGAPVFRTMTGIRFLLTSLVNPTSKAAKVLQGVGISADDLRKSVREKGLIKTLQDLRRQLPLQDFLKVVGGARGVIVALGLVGKHAATVDKIMGKVRDSTGSTDRAFKAMSEGPGFKFRKALNDLKIALEQFGDTIEPVLIVLAKGISAVATSFSGLGTAGAVLAAGLFFLGPMLRVVAFGFKILAANTMLAKGATMGATVASEGLAATLLANPIGLVVVAVIALGVAFFILYKKVKMFRDIVNATVTWIKTHWRLIALRLGVTGIAIILIVNHFKQLRTIVRTVIHWVEVLIRQIGRIKFPKIPGSGIIKKGAGFVGGALGTANRLLGGHADGGAIHASGMALVGERGPEIVSLPAGARVHSHEDSFGRTPIHVTVQSLLDGKVVAESTARVVSDRKARR